MLFPLAPKPILFFKRIIIVLDVADSVVKCGKSCRKSRNGARWRFRTSKNPL